MSSIETYYLIDFENVHEEGFIGSQQLGHNDHIHLFSTKNAPKISIETLCHLNSVNLISHEIPVGNQSLDMHLISYLGYLIGKKENHCKYVIISNDTDYDNVITFWKEQNITNITRQTKISSIQNNSAKTTPLNSNTTVTDSQKRCQLNTEVQRAIKNAGYNGTYINKVASIVVKCYGEETFANCIHNELRRQYNNYSDLYKSIKPVIEKYSSTHTKKKNTSTQLNDQILKALNSTDLNNNDKISVASLACMHQNQPNNKNTIYRSLVMKYGQQRALNIYNHIKKLL